MAKKFQYEIEMVGFELALYSEEFSTLNEAEAFRTRLNGTDLVRIGESKWINPRHVITVERTYR